MAGLRSTSRDDFEVLRAMSPSDLAKLARYFVPDAEARGWVM